MVRDEKLWAIIPAPKIFWYLGLFLLTTALLHLILLLLYRRPIALYWQQHVLDLLVYTALCINAWLGRTAVTTNNDGVRIRSFTNNQFIPWKDIDEFNIAENSVALRAHFAVRPIVIELRRLKESPAFIKLIQTQMVKAKDIECLQCGTLIRGDSEQCPECGWSWQKVPNVNGVEKDVSE